MRIGGFGRTSLLDWRGKVACVIYLAGCDFRCPYCHNKEIVADPEKADDIDEEKIFQFIQENSDFLDGVVISGGEPTIDHDLVKLIKKLRSMKMMIKLDTNGSNPDVLDDLIGAGYVDAISMDIKSGLTRERYSAAAGVDIDPELIRRSIRIIMDSGIDYEFRTTVSPILVKPEDIESICKEIKGAKLYTLQQFRPNVCIDSRLEAMDPYKESVIRQMAETAKKYVKKVEIKGL